MRSTSIDKPAMSKILGAKILRPLYVMLALGAATARADEVGHVDRPRGGDAARLYAQNTPPAPTAPAGDFKCPSDIPFAPVVELKTLSATSRRPAECLDAARPQTIFNFEITGERQIRIILGAENAELNVELSSGAKPIWSAVNTTELTKGLTRAFPAGRYSLRIWPQGNGSAYRLVLAFQE
jgi:hypothetical protein